MNTTLDVRQWTVLSRNVHKKVWAWSFEAAVRLALEDAPLADLSEFASVTDDEGKEYFVWVPRYLRPGRYDHVPDLSVVWEKHTDQSSGNR